MKRERKKKLSIDKLVDKYEISIGYSATDKCWIANAPALKGCMSHGETPEEALINGRDAVLSWLDVAVSEGLPIPKPDIQEYSGKFNARISKSLHEALAKQSKREGVSLNQLLSQYIAQGIERRRA